LNTIERLNLHWIVRCSEFIPTIEKDGHGIVLDLKDLTLVDREAVSFLEALRS